MVPLSQGTEFLNSLDNPYDVYNVPSVQQARKLFEKHNYEAAAILLEGVVDNLSKYAESYGLQNEQDAVNKSCYMADCYGLWDAFDYSAAKNSKEDMETYGTTMLSMLCPLQILISLGF